jgi:hypothetical protein
MTKTYETREQWLMAGVDELRPIFAALGKPLPQAIRVACGFPLDAKRSKALGQCWASTASADRTIEILITPELADPVAVFQVLVHELCHATAGAMNHGVNFQRIATLMKLEPTNPTMRDPWRATVGDPSFNATYADIIVGLGDYPHAELTFNTRKTQGTRMLKAFCPSCGYTIRLTAKWAVDASGAPNLPSCPNDGDTFTL